MRHAEGTNQPLCGAVILNWMDVPHTLKCCRSVIDSDYPNLLLIVCDNASPDGSYSRLQEAFTVHFELVDSDRSESTFKIQRAGTDRSLILLLNDNNFGYAKGTNIGIRRALDAQCSRVLILNHDTEINPDALTLMLKKSDEGRYAIVGPTVCDYTDRSTILTLGGHFNRWSGLTTQMSADTTIDSKVIDGPSCDYVPGCCALVRRDFLDEVGLMREDFFLYAEELEWACRAREAGWELGIEKQAIVYHRDIRKDADRRAVATYYTTRNTLYVVASFFPFSLPIALLLNLVRVPWLVFHGRRRDARSVANALLAFLCGRKGRIDGDGTQ